MKHRYRSNRGSNLKANHGTTMIECVVSASILVVVISTVTTFVFRVGRVWMEISHQRSAIHELSNQMESLTLLPLQEIPAAIESLSTSPGVAQSLTNAAISGELIQDDDGNRIRLQLSWQAAHPIRPVELIGWVVPSDETPEEISGEISEAISEESMQ